jgi:formylglycine-generating enzyme required for sulfatase activity
MFAFEATRYDSSATSAGMDSSRRPCSAPGRLPWANIKKEDALAACGKLGTGWRLCTADEWFDACNGTSNTVFPYGNAFDPTKCNGADFPKAATATTIPVGNATMCVSEQGGQAPSQLLDMSGNVREWVITGSPSANPLKYELRGGAYNVASFNGSAPGLQCDSTIPAPDDTEVRLPSVGFRCCKDGAL